MSLAVFWESFLSDILIAHMVRRPKQCRKVNAGKIQKSIADKFPGSHRWVSIEMPQKPSPEQVERMLDPKGWNITFKSAVDLRERANLWLVATDAQKFSLNADDAAFFDYLIAIRNFLGHRSSAARSTMIGAVAALNPQTSNSELCGAARQLGAYLKQATTSGRRVNSISERVLSVAASLSR
ncbi:MAG: hypothetical protein ACLGSH_17780 [Acidobacteriota bacterium]